MNAAASLLASIPAAARRACVNPLAIRNKMRPMDAASQRGGSHWQELSRAMPFLKLDKVVKRFGSVPVIQGVSFEAEKSEFVVFVGPSGCGKSTLLRMIAGLEEISEGDVSIDGRVVTGVAPADREVSMVFQSYALYPHMSVFDNIAFGLKMARMPKEAIKTQVDEAARILQIDPLLDRKPRQLSGGQRQRVAHRPRHRAPTQALSVRRAAVEPRRRAADADAGGDRQTASRSRRHHGLRHA